MKNIKVKHGNASFGINKEWAMKFKTEGDFLKAMEGKLSNIKEPKRTEILKEEYAKLQPAAPQTVGEAKVKK